MSGCHAGADIANICNEAALFAARTAKKAVTSDDFDYAVERVVAGTAKKTRILSPVEKRRVAYHEAGHALIGWLMKHTDALLKVGPCDRTSSHSGGGGRLSKSSNRFTVYSLYSIKLKLGRMLPNVSPHHRSESDFSVSYQGARLLKSSNQFTAYNIHLIELNGRIILNISLHNR